MLPIAWNIQNSPFTKLWPFKGITIFHSYRNKKFQNREQHLSYWRFTRTSKPDLHRQLQEQKILATRSLQQQTLLNISLDSNSRKMVLWDTCPPSFQSAGFPNKVAIPCAGNWSLDLLACCVVSSMTLDLVTVWRQNRQVAGQPFKWSLDSNS